MIALVLALTLSGCASDADCSLTLHCGCSCCQEDVAVDAAGLEEERSRCAHQGSCGGMEKCRNRHCPGPERGSWRAVCEAGQCVKKSIAACTADSDCVLQRGCGCECCPELRALSKGAAEAQQQACAKVGPCRDSTRCKACPKEPPAVAVCRAGQCEKAGPDAGR